jgi:putative hydrolase of the HAD superfamily
VITTVISDFGGVLTNPLWEAFAVVQADFGIEPEALGSAMAAVMEREGVHPLHELETGRLSEPAFMSMLGDELRAQLGRDVGMHRFSDVYWAELRVNEPVVELLRELKAAGYRLALLTNNVREWEPRWRAMLPIDELFEDVVDSGFVGLRKPDRAIYELSCSRLGVAPSECLFLDDFPHNCDAARELGMNAVWFQDTPQAIQDVRDVLAESGAVDGSSPLTR